MNTFQEMELSPLLIQALDKLGFVQPTSIQAHTIPIALQQKDIMGSAQTGTGKTLAFALPLINQLLSNPTGTGLILAPTRELAQQVLATINQLLSKRIPMRTALLIGGEPYAKQLAQLRWRPRIIIGTPGRVIDHLDRGTLQAKIINFLVLDETDRMFDMGFSIQLEHIIKQLPTNRQTLMFSATFPPSIEKLAAKYLQSPMRVFLQEIQETGIVADNLTQETIEIKERDKYEELLHQLTSREGTILVFVKTKYDAEQLAIQLGKDGHSTCAIHGNLRQSKRERIMRSFRQGKHRIMVGTDIVARGLDVPHVMHVVNYDIPYTPEDYIHRIGRTARAGAKGFAVSFISGADRKRWKAIQDMLHPSSVKIQDKEERSFDRNRRPRTQDRRPYAKDHNRPYAPGKALTREEQKTRFRPGYQGTGKSTRSSNWSSRPLVEKKPSLLKNIY
jgi:superfamily II DNA/RNA helicase